MRSDYLREQGIGGLLSTYAAVMHMLRNLGIARSFNNPVADVAEWLVSEKLDLTRMTNSSKGYDATDKGGMRYQIKARWLATPRSSRQLSAIRDLTLDPFDYLIAVMFSDEFHVEYAAQMPIEFVRLHSKPVARTNSYRFHFTRGMLTAPGVLDLSEILRVFPPSTEMERRIVALGAIDP